MVGVPRLSRASLFGNPRFPKVHIVNLPSSTGKQLSSRPLFLVRVCFLNKAKCPPSGEHFTLVGVPRLELGTSCSQSRRTSQLCYTPTKPTRGQACLSMGLLRRGNLRSRFTRQSFLNGDVICGANRTPMRVMRFAEQIVPRSWWKVCRPISNDVPTLPENLKGVNESHENSNSLLRSQYQMYKLHFSTPSAIVPSGVLYTS